jgi:hypothetical protein
VSPWAADKEISSLLDVLILGHLLQGLHLAKLYSNENIFVRSGRGINELSIPELRLLQVLKGLHHTGIFTE